MEIPYDILRKICADMDYKTLIKVEYISKYFLKFIRNNPQLFHWKVPKYITSIKDLQEFKNTIGKELILYDKRYPHITFTI